MPLVGVLAGTSDPSEIGTSAASLTNVLSRGGRGMLVLPLSFFSNSARLVLALMRLLILGLKDDPSVSAAQPSSSRLHHASRASEAGAGGCPFRGEPLDSDNTRDKQPLIRAMCSQ